MIKKIASILTVAIMLLAVNDATAQNTGTITGMIIDGSNGEALLGASVLIQGTSRGAPSGMDGRFTIRNVQPGEYTLVATYIGYDREYIDVVVEAGEETEVEIVMDWSGVSGDEVVISAQARGQTSAINEQLRSRTITNIVSSERIRELPDANAATALSRLPGVSLQDGDKVVIRGMQAKLNTVSVNGIQLPSTDMNDRSTNLGFISSNMLDGVEVTKAVTPDMDANAVGGAVNLRLREARSDWHFDGLLQGSYNTQDRTVPGQNFQAWGSISNRFFDDKLGVFLQGNANRRDGGGDIAATNWGRMGPGSNAPYGEATYGMEDVLFIDEVHIVEEFGGSAIIDYRFGDSKFVLQNTIAMTNSDMARHRDILFLRQRERQYRISRDVNDRQLIINALQGEHLIGDLKIDYNLSHAFTNRITDIRYGDPGENFGFNNPESPPYPFEELSEARRLTMGFDEIYNLELTEDDWQGAQIYENAGNREENFEQRNLTAALNFTLPITIGNNIDAEFKIGGKVAHTIRENDIHRTIVRIVEPGHYEGAREWMMEQDIDPDNPLQFSDFRDSSYGDNRGSYFLGGQRDINMPHVIDTELMDEFIRHASPLWNVHDANSNVDDFEANETVSAGYIMGSFDIGNNLDITTGVRYEHFHMDYNANFVYMTHSVDGDAIIANDRSPGTTMRELADSLTNVQRDFGHFFPNFQARYSFTDWMDLRFAYTRTLSRPDFNNMIPNVFRANDNRGGAGNPYLNPTISNNLDLSLSIYNNEIGLFTVGGFYKKMDDVFYSIRRMYSALPEGVNFPEPEIFQEMGLQVPRQTATIDTYFNNPHSAYIHGFEFDWQTNFWYLPDPFSSIVLNINYTRIFSEMDYQQINIENVQTGTDDLGIPQFETVELDTFRTARLLHQGDHIINVALGADYRGFSGRVSFRLQGDVITYIGNRPEQDTFSENVYGFDFSIRQQLPIEGLSLAITGVNISHAPQKSFRYFRRDVDENPGKQLSDERYYPRRFELGLRYSF